LDWDVPMAELGCSPGDALLAVHRSYLEPVQRLLSAGVAIHGLAHITGGGLVDNPPRIFPEGLEAVLHRGSWSEPPIFGLIQYLGEVSDAEMFHVFNMGLGMLAIVPAEEAPLALKILPGDAFVVGEMRGGYDGVVIQ
jgi:phosphoribosylformylglycinamidine cyclo-ligase